MFGEETAFFRTVKIISRPVYQVEVNIISTQSSKGIVECFLIFFECLIGFGPDF